MTISLGSFFKGYLALVIFGLSLVPSMAQDTLEISEIEYFFDIDPGVGSATSIAVSPPDSLVSTLETLNSSSLEIGFHVLGFRARNLAPRPAFYDSVISAIDTTVIGTLRPTDLIDATLLSSGMWGITETRLVFVDQSDVGATVLVDSLEYFFDTDPGVGSATIVDGFAAASQVALSSEILTSDTLSFGFHILGMRAKAEGKSWGTTETRLVFVDQSDVGTAVNVDSLEYFFDIDPGVGNATIIDGFTAANTIALSNEILTSDTLEFGFHVLGMRPKAEGGSWGTTETRLVFVDQSDVGTTVVVDSLEYFFDTDPGVGNATIIDGFTAANSIVLGSEILTADTLNFGFHVLGMRAKAEGGSWGTTETRLVFVDQSDVGATVLVDSLEYFFDEDPGVGSATIIDGFTAANSIVFGSEILTADTLNFGFHVLGMRAKAEGGSWGTTETRIVFVDPSGSGGIVNVDQIEYYFDTDPGVGSGTIINTFTPNSLVSLNETLNTSGLSVGFHTLGIRARAEGGDWGLVENKLVYVDFDNTITDITDLEIFVDIDPGVGSGTPIPVTTPGVEISEIIDFMSDTLSIGQHEVGIRARNQNGDWGMTESRTMGVVDIGPPAISVIEGNPSNLDTVTLEVVFTEAVNSFVETDVQTTAGGAIVAGSFLTVNDSTYTLELDMLIEGAISIDIADSAAFTNDDSSPSPAAITYDVFYDVTSPTVGIDPLTTTDLTPLLTGTIDDDSASVSITVDGSVYAASSVTGGVWTLDQGVVTPLAAGIYDVEVTATDLAGNAGSDATTDELTVNSTALIALPATLVTDTSFVANWGGGTDVANYEVDISDVADFSTFLPGFENLTITATSDTVTGLDFASNYFYRVRFVDNSSTVSANSNVVTVSTLIDASTVADSTALVQIYAALDGSNWTPAVNWETARLRDWDGVSLDAGIRRRVDMVNISGLGASGAMPNPFTGDAIGGLTLISSMDLSNNAISGLMDFSSTTISDLNVSGNALEFDDLEPIVGIATVDYSNQADILFNEDTGGDAIEVRHLSDTIVSISTGGTANSYEFTRNGTAVTQGADFTISGDTLEILSIDFENMGEFAANVTSSLVPGLTIQATPLNVFAVADLDMSIVDQSDVLLTDPISGYMLEAFRREQGFDTLERVEDSGSSFTFPDVVLGDYLIGIDPSNRELFIPTYFGNEFEWELADTLFFRAADAVQIRMAEVPDESTEGDGVLNVLIEEDFGDDGGRIDARRRAARRKCGLKRRRSTGRGEQDQFDLFAYGETDDNGEFQFGFLPEGVYRFFVEYPGIPLDDNAFVEFEVGEFGITDTEFSLTAFATEEGIEINIERVLGIIFDYFKNLKVYPNPTSDVVNITFRHLKSENVSAQLVDLAGNSYWQSDIKNGFDGNVTIDVSEYSEGIYLLHIFDKESRNKNVVTYRIIVKE